MYARRLPWADPDGVILIGRIGHVDDNNRTVFIALVIPAHKGDDLALLIDVMHLDEMAA